MLTRQTSQTSELRRAPAHKRPTDWMRAVWAWITLPGLIMFDYKAITEFTLSRTSPERLSRRIDGTTWVTGLAIVAGLALLGQGRWNWETAVAVGAIFAANGFNRLQFGLHGAKVALGLALSLYLVGLAGALGLAVPAAQFAYVILLLHAIGKQIWPAENGDQAWVEGTHLTTSMSPGDKKARLS